MYDSMDLVFCPFIDGRDPQANLSIVLQRGRPRVMDESRLNTWKLVVALVSTPRSRSSAFAWICCPCRWKICSSLACRCCANPTLLHFNLNSMPQAKTSTSRGHKSRFRGAFSAYPYFVASPIASDLFIQSEFFGMSPSLCRGLGTFSRSVTGSSAGESQCRVGAAVPRTAAHFVGGELQCELTFYVRVITYS